MKKVCFGVATVAVLVSGCAGLGGVSGASSKSQALDNTQAAPDYFPLVQGATWTYKLYTYATPDESGTGTLTGSKILTVQSVVKAGDQATASMGERDLDKQGNETGVSSFSYVRTLDGLYTITGSQKPDSTTLLVPFPLSVGATTVADATVSDDATYSAVIRTISDKTTLGTDVGTLTGCFESSVDSTKQSIAYLDYLYYGHYVPQLAVSTSSVKVYFAPNVGLVKKMTLITTPHGEPNSGDGSVFYTFSDLVSIIATYSIPKTNP